jgi:hypothetical protein
MPTVYVRLRQIPPEKARSSNDWNLRTVGSMLWTDPLIKELDCVVLTAPLAEEGLEAGDVGTVVHVYPNGCAFDVEFTTLEGKTAAVVTVEAGDVRPVGGREISHAREISARE